MSREWIARTSRAMTGGSRVMTKGGRAMTVTVAAAVLAFAPAYSAMAWGPERETFKWETAAPYRTMNSITDNSAVGDERNFVRVRKVGDEKFGNEVSVVVGQEYEVMIYFHNNASRTLNDSGAGIANNVRMYSVLPEFVAKGSRGEISGMISAGNTTPEKVWDEAHVNTSDNVYLRYVPDSAIIHSNGTINGEHISPDYLFGKEGALIGYYKDGWGLLPGCNEFAGYVSYKFRVDQPGYSLDKTVSRDGQNEWTQSITAAPGELLNFKLHYKNTGTTEQDNVTLTDVLPDGLEYVPGSTFLVNGSEPNGKYVSDDLFGAGVNIGKYQPGSEATLTYKVRMPEAGKLQCGSNKYTNSASVTTSSGSVGDKVEVDVINNCAVSELPITGPADVIIMSVAILAVGVGGVYWWRSNKMLREAKKAVGVDKDGDE